MTIWRVGKTLGRTLYMDDVCVGMVDAVDVAHAICAVMNAAEDWVTLPQSEYQRGRADERKAILFYLRRELSAYCSDELDAVEGMEHLKDGGKGEG